MRQAATKDSALMLAALGILAYAASMMTHEALGHGGYCLAAGGHSVMLTPWWETCKFPGAPPLGIKAAGPGVQFGAGLLTWLALHLVSPSFARLRYFFWLYMVFNLFDSCGYVAFSGLTNFGDTAEIIARLHPPIMWRGGLVVLGSMAYFLSMRAAAFEIKRFAGVDDGISRLFRLVWIPYASAGGFACCTGVLSQAMAHGAAIGLAAASPAMNQSMGHHAAIRLAAISSFGAGAGMFGLPAMQQGMKSIEVSPTAYLGRSPAWAVAAAVVVVFFLFFVGPGLT